MEDAIGGPLNDQEVVVINGTEEEVQPDTPWFTSLEFCMNVTGFDTDIQIECICLLCEFEPFA